MSAPRSVVLPEPTKPKIPTLICRLSRVRSLGLPSADLRRQLRQEPNERPRDVARAVAEDRPRLVVVAAALGGGHRQLVARGALHGTAVAARHLAHVAHA